MSNSKNADKAYRTNCIILINILYLLKIDFLLFTIVKILLITMKLPNRLAAKMKENRTLPVVDWIKPIATSDIELK